MEVVVILVRRLWLLVVEDVALAVTKVYMFFGTGSFVGFGGGEGCGGGGGDGRSIKVVVRVVRCSKAVVASSGGGSVAW